jgi:hypothetical protein
MIVNWKLVGPKWQLQAPAAMKPRARTAEGMTKMALVRLHGGRWEQQAQPYLWLLAAAAPAQCSATLVQGEGPQQRC